MDLLNTSIKQSAVEVSEREYPAVLVVRDPDTSDRIELFGLPDNVKVIDVDLGSSFDIGRPASFDETEVRDWASGNLEEVQELPPAHRARLAVEEIVEFVRSRFGLNEESS
jgi:hypothetical protein